MPRSSGASAKRPGANQHNTRHENGLAAPGKRINSKRSNGNLNCHANGKLLYTPPLSPATGRTTVPSSSENGSNSSLPDSRNRPNGKTHVNGNGRRYSDGSSDGLAPYQHGVDTGSVGAEERHRRIDVNASKAPGVHDSHAMSLPATVLASAPLADTIALLIILLQIPPTFLTIIHVLFATLTFVPPTAGSSLSSFSSFSDLQGSNGTPSLSTVILADIVIGAFSVLLWPTAREYVLELAQAVIALSLGGGYTGKGGNGGFKNAAVCAGIIFLSQAARRGSRQPSHAFDTPHTPSVPSRSLSPLPDFNSLKTSRGWIRSIIAVHILAQGVVRAIRRWISRREQGGAGSSAGADPEAAAGSQTPSDHAVHVESAANGLNNFAVDGHTMSSSKDGGGKPPGGKKKKKQGNHVRNQQPLWAALASTKVIVMKEMEQSLTMAEAAESKATDINNLGSAPFTSEEGRIWITNIGPTEISFGTSFFSTRKISSSGVEVRNTYGSGPPGVDKSKPFYVRVNRATWTSTRIYSASERDTHARPSDWAGEIFGLTPISSYECEFVRSEDGTVVYATNVTTLAEPTAEPLPSPIGHQSLRPSSPTTTLKNSIAVAETKLSDERARLKRARKDHKSHISGLKKEVESYGARLANSGSGDERQRQRVLQITQHIRQAEEAAAAICAEIEALGGIPEEDAHEWKQQKKLWEAEKQRLATAHTEVDEMNAKLERQVASVQAELSAIQQKSERLQARQAKLSEQHDRIANANAKGLDEKERQAAESAAREAERTKIEQHYSEQILHLQRQIQDYTFRSHQVWQQVQAHETALFQQKQQRAQQHSQQQQQQQQQQVMAQSPTTSEGNLSTTMPSHSSRSGFGGPFAFPFGSQQSPVSSNNPSSTLSIQPPPLYREGRGRSSSMLSYISGLTDFSDPDPARPMPVDMADDVERERERSESIDRIESVVAGVKRELVNSSPGVIGEPTHARHQWGALGPK
ncbi:hypothetical protein FGG08_003060 [Glutinoglossum americanum]|uniref:Ubiquitination network signaling protein n=1 Tax=Glutinoglossum americanum TaxID=1670608 RepID=A0A9P8L3Z0_9PEZI|nr:hypothetical protein FGG08_003060 [Glutinoglossum americanum]